MVHDAWGRLLGAAVFLTVRHGYVAATAELAVSTVGLPPDVARRFDGANRRLSLVAYDTVASGVVAEALRRARRESDHVERLRAGFGFLFEQMASHPEIAYVWVVELPQTGVDALRCHERALSAIGELVRPDGAKRSELHEQFLVGGVWEIVRRTLLRDGAAALPGRLADVVGWAAGGARGNGA